MDHMIKTIYFFGALFLLLCVSNLSAATYYVDNDGGNDANSGISPLSAWKTISKVNSKGFNSGDTISFKCNQRFTGATLTPNRDNLVFNSYGSGARPVIDGQSARVCMEIGSRGYITIIGIKFVKGINNPGGQVGGWGAHNILFESCNIDSGSGNTYVHSNLYFGGHSSYITVRNSTLSYAENNTSAFDGGLGFYIDGIDHCLMEYDTLIGNFSNIRIAFGDGNMTTNTIIRYCVVKNGRWDNVDDDGSNGVQFYYNLFEATCINVYFFTDGSGLYDQYASRNVSYYNNTFITHGSDGSIHVHSKTGITNGIVFKNNVFYSDNSAGYFLYEELDGSSWPMGSWTFTNNIYYMTSPCSHKWYRHGVKYSSISKWQFLGYDANSIYTDPLFTNYPLGDYSLKSGSKAISNGIALGLAADIFGTPVPSTNPDIGAYQNLNPK
jgi:hypothetical protein